MTETAFAKYHPDSDYDGEWAQNRIELSGPVRFGVDPVDAVVISEQAQEATQARQHLESVLSQMVTQKKIPETDQILTLCYWDALAKEIESKGDVTAYNPEFVLNPALSGATLIGPDRLEELGINKRVVDVRLLRTRQALVKFLFDNKDQVQP